MPAATSFDTVGNREDILDIISTVDPEVTPMFSSLPKLRGPKALLLEWQADELTLPSGFDGIPDGTDQSVFDDKAKDRVRIGNRIQIIRRSYGVSQLQEMVETAGAPSEFARSKSKAMTELNTDIESVLGSDKEQAIGSGTVGDQMRGFGAWINDTNVNIPEGIRTPTASIGTTSSLVESSFNSVIQSTYEQSGKTQSFRLFAGPTLQNKITNFTRAEGSSTATPLQVVTDSTTKKLVFSITMYDSDFGTIMIIPDLFLGRVNNGDITTQVRERGYLLNPEMVNISMMENPTSFELENQGGGRRGFAELIGTLCVKNPKGLGKFV